MKQDREHQFSVTKLSLKDDYEGWVEATVLSKKANKPSDQALLYIHGFIDYFFQYELSDWANDQGLNFYAIDLRKYGRSLLPHQKPNHFKDYTEYFEELDSAVEMIRKSNKRLILMGHSTGGLIASLYTHQKRSQSSIDGLILNSPFFDFNMPCLQKKLGLPLIAALGRIWPNLSSPSGLKRGYAESIHNDFYGEWDFDLRLKPIEGFSPTLGWIRGIYRAQKELQKGLEIKVPVLLMHSSRSVKPGDYHSSMHNADAVLDIEDMKKYAKGLGLLVEVIEIQDGIHDLLLSKQVVRDRVYLQMKNFLLNHKLI